VVAIKRRWYMYEKIFPIIFLTLALFLAVNAELVICNLETYGWNNNRLFFSLNEFGAMRTSNSWSNETFYTGDLIIDDNETVVIHNCRFVLTGSIIVKENATLILRNAELFLNLTSNWTTAIRSYDTSHILFENASVRSERFFLMEVYQNSTFEGKDIDTENFHSIYCHGSSKVTIKNRNFTQNVFVHYFEVYDHSILSITNSTVTMIETYGSATLILMNSKVTHSVWIGSAFSKVSVNGVQISLIDSETFYLVIPYYGGEHMISFRAGYFEDEQIIGTNPTFSINLTRTTVKCWYLKAYGSAVLNVNNADIYSIEAFDNSTITINNSTISHVTTSGNSIVYANQSLIRVLNNGASALIFYCYVSIAYLNDLSSIVSNNSRMFFICYSWDDQITLNLYNSTLLVEITYNKDAAVPWPTLRWISPPSDIVYMYSIAIRVFDQSDTSKYQIKMYYDLVEEKLSLMGIEETDLLIYERDASTSWILSSPQGVNNYLNFVWVNVTNLPLVDKYYLLAAPIPPSKIIRILSDGSVDPPTAPIQSNGDLYILTGNISDIYGIVIERDNIILDGAGFAVQGIGCFHDIFRGIELSEKSNVTIKNVEIVGFRYGIYINHSSNNTILMNNIRNNHVGIYLFGSSGNMIYHNNFINNTIQSYVKSGRNIWDNGYPLGGNYWSDYSGTDLFSGPYQNKTGSDGIGDTPYIIGVNNTDRYPLMSPFGGLTSEGQNVTAYPSSDVCLIFENVTQEGSTTVSVTDDGPEPPSGFKLAEKYYDIETTANYSGKIKIRIIYDDTNMTTAEEMSLRLMQWNETSNEWVDITTMLDMENNVIYGETTHLSIFALTTVKLTPSGGFIKWKTLSIMTR